MSKLAVEDILRLEQETAFQALLDEAKAVRVVHLENNARDVNPGLEAQIERAKRLGEITQIEYLLDWVNKERRKNRNLKLEGK